jgi:hypothetical protein
MECAVETGSNTTIYIYIYIYIYVDLDKVWFSEPMVDWGAGDTQMYRQRNSI